MLIFYKIDFQVHSRFGHAKRDNQWRSTRSAECADVHHHVWNCLDFKLANRNRSLDKFGCTVRFFF